MYTYTASANAIPLLILLCRLVVPTHVHLYNTYINTYIHTYKCPYIYPAILMFGYIELASTNTLPLVVIYYGGACVCRNFFGSVHFATCPVIVAHGHVRCTVNCRKKLLLPFISNNNINLQIPLSLCVMNSPFILLLIIIVLIITIFHNCGTFFLSPPTDTPVCPLIAVALYRRPVITVAASLFASTWPNRQFAPIGRHVSYPYNFHFFSFFLQ